MKFSLPLALLAVLAFSACNTLENRRSLYSTQKVHGPYTRHLEEGTWADEKSVDEQYAENRAQQHRPKLIQGEKKTVPAGATVTPDPVLPQ